MPLLRLAMQFPICFYSNTLLNCFPGNCRVIALISKLKVVLIESGDRAGEKNYWDFGCDAAAGCGLPKPISSGVSLGKTTSRPRERKFE